MTANGRRRPDGLEKLVQIFDMEVESYPFFRDRVHVFVLGHLLQFVLEITLNRPDRGSQLRFPLWEEAGVKRSLIITSGDNSFLVLVSFRLMAGFDQHALPRAV